MKNVANSIAFLIVPGGSKQRGNRTKAAGQDNIVTACAHFAVSVSRVKSFIIRILKRFNVELLFFGMLRMILPVVAQKSPIQGDIANDENSFPLERFFMILQVINDRQHKPRSSGADGFMKR
ncbi:MAG TPA: hypothetical protein VFC07_10335 [Verrucomicrobiae bacterium]|nr:hypothetical protein [Verrucomicrobiae bacterium]